MSEFSRDESAEESRPSPSTDRTPQDRPPEPRLVATAAWLGLMVGMIEVGVLVFQAYQNRVATIGALRLNQHYPWMIPVAHLAIFVAFGLALELFEKIRPQAARQVSSLVLGSLVILELLVTIRVLSTIACVLLGCGIAANLVPRLARYQWAFQRLVRASLLPMAVGLVLLVIGRHAQARGGDAPFGAEAASGGFAERAAPGPRHGSGQKPEPVRLSSSDLAEHRSTRRQRRDIRRGPLDRS